MWWWVVDIFSECIFYSKEFLEGFFKMEHRIKKVLLSEEQIQKRIDELAEQINIDYEGKSVIMIGILRGAVMFFTDLAKRLTIPVKMDFMAVSSYSGGTRTSGVVRMVHDLAENIEGKDVLIVEDIVDSGLTLSYLVNNLTLRKPNSIRICCLLDKPYQRTRDIETNYVGFEIANEFVVGYGLDYKEYYRNLPYVGVLDVE